MRLKKLKSTAINRQKITFRPWLRKRYGQIFTCKLLYIESSVFYNDIEHHRYLQWPYFSGVPRVKIFERRHEQIRKSRFFWKQPRSKFRPQVIVHQPNYGHSQECGKTKGRNQEGMIHAKTFIRKKSMVYLKKNMNSLA